MYDRLTSSEVKGEIFESVRKELRDEINVQFEDQEPPLLLGEIRTMTRAGRCGLDFLIRLKINKEEVQRRYLTGKQSEADESVHLIFIPINVIESWQFTDDKDLTEIFDDNKGGHTSANANFNHNLNQMYSEMTGHCQGGLRLLYLHLQKLKNQ